MRVRRLLVALATAAAACTTSPPASPMASSTGSDETTGVATLGTSTEAATVDPTSGDATDADSTGESPVPCTGTELRVVAYNVESVGATGSSEWDALASILRRLGPDLACIEEVDEFDVGPLRDLAEALGWGEPIFADASPAIGGDLRNACLGPSTSTIRRIASWGSELSGDGSANDVGRDLLAVEVIKDGCSMAVIGIHAKSGQEPIDFFRRQVEFVRIGQAIDALREQGHDAIAVVGDFNENVDDPALGTELTSLPDGLPRSYRVGNDIELPMTYHPFALLEAAGLERLDPTREDSAAVGTWGADRDWDGVRLDYVFHDGVGPTRSVVYSACDDDGIDAPPAGAWIPLVGEPLPCFASTTASDHLPIAVDFALQP